MTRAKLALCIGVAILLVGGTTTKILSSDGSGDNLTPSEIFKKAQEKYASMTSYSDEGKTVETIDTTNSPTFIHTFTIRLDRPSLYRIEWVMNIEMGGITEMTAKSNAVWSAGDGDFLAMAGDGAEKMPSEEIALSSSKDISGYASSTIPPTFFNLNWGSQLGGSVTDEKQQPDEKVGDVDCYVLTDESKKGITRTLWIGKQDFLIHQIRNVTSPEAMKAMMVEEAKSHPEILAHMTQSGILGSTSVETHQNIIENPVLTALDFAR